MKVKVNGKKVNFMLNKTENDNQEAKKHLPSVGILEILGEEFDEVKTGLKDTKKLFAECLSSLALFSQM